MKWKKGGQGRGDRKVLVQILVETIDRLRSGAIPSLGQELERHPHLAREIVRQTELLGLLEAAGRSSESVTASPGAVRLGRLFVLLEPWLQEAILLHDVAKRSWAEIGRLLCIPPRRLQQRHARFIERLREQASC